MIRVANANSSLRSTSINMKAAKKVTISHSRSIDSRDAAIGRLVRAQRRQLRLSQSDLADRIGVARQQVRRYETGLSRISIGRLARIATTLGVPPTFFFGPQPKNRATLPDQSLEFLATEGALRLIKAYDRFPGRGTQIAFLQLAEDIAKQKRRGGRRRPTGSK
jgi:transcriptional regulator with XRE-family HTH domain